MDKEDIWKSNGPGRENSELNILLQQFPRAVGMSPEGSL